MIKIIKPTSINFIFSRGNYLFYSVQLENEVSFDDKYERTIYCLDGSFSLENHVIEKGDSVQLKGWPVTLYGKAVLLVAQVKNEDSARYLEITRTNAHYKVTKPWGYELWINSKNDAYCAKVISIKSGTKTSLQYHDLKEETNLIQSGKVRFVYSKEEVIDDPNSVELFEEEFDSPVCFHITPKTIHRIAALTDLMLFEVSTPQLDDVIRLQDDANRGNGRIESEHK